MNPAEFKSVLEQLGHAIISTDLQLYFPTQKYLNAIIQKENKIDLDDDEQLKMTIALMMTGCDLVAMCKPFTVYLDITAQLYQEFYMQGDMEKRLGLQPVQMMDRRFKDKQPQEQIGFIAYICLPCYTTLKDCLPESKPLLDGCMEIYNEWQWRVKQTNLKMWVPSSSVPFNK